VRLKRADAIEQHTEKARYDKNFCALTRDGYRSTTA
jgi:hypothetical protein